MYFLPMKHVNKAGKNILQQDTGAYFDQDNRKLPIIAASTKRLSRLHTIIFTPRGVGRILRRGPPRGGCGGNGGGGTLR